MSPRSITRFLPLAFVALLFGCAEGKINYVHVDSSYDPTVYAHLPYTGPIYADVAGNPFGAMPQPQLQSLVNAYIQPSQARSPEGQGVRVHFAFGETASDRNSACYAGGNNAPNNGTINMVAALCRGGAATTYLVASVDGITGPNDPRFQNFLRNATVQLFPRQDPNRDPPCFLPGGC